jgi:hypothetical protein
MPPSLVCASQPFGQATCSLLHHQSLGRDNVIASRQVLVGGLKQSTCPHD